MKTLITFFLLISLVTGFAQNRIPVPKYLQNKSIQYDRYIKGDQVAESPGIPYKQSLLWTFDEENIGDTRYDNQSNASIPKKIFLFDDGTIGATWTRSMDEGSFFADRGTGYNYYNGVDWGAWPEERVEDIKVHRPVYAPWGENGELIVSHTSGDGLYIARREEKGTGDWDYNDFPGPDGNEYILWCRAVTSGVDNSHINLLALTLPESHGGTPYEGLNGALLYSLSTDGGETWLIENEILEGMTEEDFNGFAADTYAFAEPVGETVAFVVGDPWTGLFLMKSIDGGETFEKTTIWEHPYPDWELGMVTDTFYCADGSQSLAIDDDGIVHVAFGISRVESDDQDTFQYLWVDGIAYWNEEMPAFSSNIHALNPNEHPDSELVEDYNLIGWTQDVNGNGSLDFADDMGLYFIGLSSMPQLVIHNNYIILVYSSTTETYDNGLKNFRHIWIRGGTLNQTGSAWWGSFDQLSSDLIHLFDECVYPAVATNFDDEVHMIFQVDPEPGTAVWAAQHDYVDNTMVYLKAFGTVSIEDNDVDKEMMSVSQNLPNPFNGQTAILVSTHHFGNLNLKVSDLNGRIVFEHDYRNLNPGDHRIEIDGSSFVPGIYFYTISDGSDAVTHKMIVN